jgi:hypothetical protein
MNADDVIYEYVGPNPVYNKNTNPDGPFRIAYDEHCQKIRSVKGKESNYFKLLQDCCDTFDCWIDPIIEHDPESGKITYIEKPVYIQTNVTDSEEPQIYVGERAKIKKVDDKIRKLKIRYGVDTSEAKI